MRNAISFTLPAVMLLVSGVASAQVGLSLERTGLGLKPQARAATDLAFGSEAAQVWQVRGPSDYALYSGARDWLQTGLRPAESYAGIVYSFSGGWGSSLEAGYVQESLVTPRSYALTGQLHTELSDGRMLSVGLKYRVYDTDASRFGAAGETTIGNGYTLAPYRVPGAVLAPSYQLQFSYQHSAASTFGMAVGRDVETFTPHFDLPSSGPRQFSFTGQHWLTPSWALSYDLMSQDATSPLRMYGLRLGVRYRF
jgi:hypothetical protein